MAFHLNEFIYALPKIPLRTNFVKIGNGGVDIFLFLSGYCLYLSLNRNCNVCNFFRKRFKRVVVVYLIVAIPFFIYKEVFEMHTPSTVHFLFNLSGLSFWLDHVLNVWFVHAIILFYILTIPFFNLVKKGIGFGLALLVVLFVANFWAHEHIPSFYNQGSIAYIRILPYVFGMVMADANERYHLQERFQGMKQYVSIIFTIILIGYFVIYLAIDVEGMAFKRFHSMGMWLSYLTIIFPILSLFLLVSKLCSKVKWLSSFLVTVGKVSLEFYMIHIMIIHIFQHQGLHTHIGSWCWLVVPVLTLPLALASNKLSEMISNKLISK
ncbi:MAG: acyltransferase [Prevotella sp.]|nr:acyltransferase [Prevotella sp.]